MIGGGGVTIRRHRADFQAKLKKKNVPVDTFEEYGNIIHQSYKNIKKSQEKIGFSNAINF